MGAVSGHISCSRSRLTVSVNQFYELRLDFAYPCFREENNNLGADYFDRINTAKLKRYYLRRLAELGCDVTAPRSDDAYDFLGKPQ